MKEYKFYVNFCDGCAGGVYTVKAKNYSSAYDKAIDQIGKKLYKAFPELEIDYDIEVAEDYDDDIFE